ASGHVSAWPGRVLTVRRSGTGGSEGARVHFPIVGEGDAIEVFTTRIDTIYGATFVLVAPEHPLGERFAAEPDGPDAFRASVAKFRAQDRTARLTGEVEKEGFDTGRAAMNPFTNTPVPIWVADFVLFEYGPGAVMGVPAHDQRDFEFASKYGLPIPPVVQPDENHKPADGNPFDGEGTLVNSGPYTGLFSADARKRMTEDVENRGIDPRRGQSRVEDCGIY